MIFPKIRIKRSVVFDFDDLIGNYDKATEVECEG